jgi:hypothetical protein
LLKNLDAIPHKYPIKINTRKTKLLPLAVCDVYDFIIEIGHEIPKQITIKASNNCDINLKTPLRL